MNNLCTIGMRAGSKGVPNKNIRELYGKPLMVYTIEQAQKSNLFNHIVVSTDSKIIAKTAKTYGAEAWFLRPPKLSTDDAPKIPVIRHALKESEKFYSCIFDVVVDLDVTSPLRNVQDITNAYQQFLDDGADILITGNPSRKNPYFNMVEKINGRINKVKMINEKITCRQDAPPVYDMNASIYIWKRDTLMTEDTLFTDQTSLYVMPEKRSIDIDNELDWSMVEFIIGNMKNNND